MNMLEQTTFNIPRINISYDKNDKDSIYIVDLVGAMLGIEDARENVLEFCKRQEEKTQEIENNILKMLEVIDRYFSRNKDEKNKQ